jgi:hypothetical protein
MLTPHLRFLGRFRDRLETVGYDPRSELYRLVKGAYEAAFSLNVHLHYASCRGGVRRGEESVKPVDFS